GDSPPVVAAQETPTRARAGRPSPTTAVAASLAGEGEGMDRAPQGLPSLKVVVVEGDTPVREFVKETIVTLGHHVGGEAASGNHMVRTVLELEPDVVVFDIHLPRMNGLDALRQIYQERIVAAVAITADRDQELVRRALEEHVLAYLVKPIEAHQL